METDISMEKKLTKAVQKASKESSLWAYAAWTLPFVALSALVFEYFIGWDHLYGKTIIVIAVTFFTVSTFWWWWSLNKFVTIIGAMRDTEEGLSSIKDELKETRKEIQKTFKDVDNR